MAKFVVTGAFGYSGKYIARRLLDEGHLVSTVTNSPDRENPFEGRVPVFAIFGDGSYRLQPIYVGDLAALAVAQAVASASVVIDAVGPETFTYRELVGVIAAAIGKPRPLVSVPPGLGYAAASVIGRFVGDVFLTREEIAGLMQGLLCTDSVPVGTTRLTDWVLRHKETLGASYASELARRRDRCKSYGSMKQRG